MLIFVIALQNDEPLKKEVIDEFASQALSGCLNLLDSLPETVYRVSELLLTVANRNGKEWRDNMLSSLTKEVSAIVLIET